MKLFIVSFYYKIFNFNSFFENYITIIVFDSNNVSK